PTPDRDWNKTLPAVQGSAQLWISELAKQADARSSFNELLDTPLDFSNFIMNRLGVDTLTPELLAGPTYELIRGSCNSLAELKYHMEEVYKATTDQLDWDNPEGQQYPHNLLQPLPLIPDNQGRRVILFAHFINNDLEYLRGGALIRKYTTYVTKTKAADYGHIKWIEDLFYGFAVNRESALDVYSKRRIIAVIDLKIVEWYNYKHLDWISEITCSCFHGFVDKDLINLVIPDVRRYVVVLTDFEEFMNVFIRIGFGFTIKLVSFDESQAVTFKGKFVSGFRNNGRGTGSRSDNTIGNSHGFIIHWIIISKNIKKVTKVIDVKNWRIDNSRVLRWVVSLTIWNSSVLSTKSSIQGTFRVGVYAWRMTGKGLGLHKGNDCVRIGWDCYMYELI
nr:hypothetical protein [Tanacetum cinerariifolium]